MQFCLKNISDFFLYQVSSDLIYNDR